MHTLVNDQGNGNLVMGFSGLGAQFLFGCCQTNSNMSLFAGKGVNLRGKELAPFVKSGGSVQFEK